MYHLGYTRYPKWYITAIGCSIGVPMFGWGTVPQPKWLSTLLLRVIG